MDNLTHSLAGWALGQAGLKTQTRKGLAALILAANMPDIDVFLGWVPWEPLAMHRGFTHSLVSGTVVMPPMLFGLLWLLDRWQVGRGTTFKSGLVMQPAWLLALCYLGALAHPLLDLLTTYSVQLWSPFSGAWFHSDGLFIIDVWVWLMLGGTIAWSKTREKRGAEWRRPVQAAIGITLAYIGLNLIVSQNAYAAASNATRDRPVDAMFASPPPLVFWHRDLVWREQDCYRRASFTPLDGLGRISRCEPTNMDDPIVREAVRRDAALQSFLRWSILPQADVQRSDCSARVTIGDARYGQGRNSRLSRDTVLPSQTGC